MWDEILWASPLFSLNYQQTYLANHQKQWTNLEQPLIACDITKLYTSESHDMTLANWSCQSVYNCICHLVTMINQIWDESNLRIFHLSIIKGGAKIVHVRNSMHKKPHMWSIIETLGIQYNIMWSMLNQCMMITISTADYLQSLTWSTLCVCSLPKSICLLPVMSDLHVISCFSCSLTLHGLCRQSYIVACRRGGVSNKPTLGSVQRQDTGPGIQNIKKETNHPFDSPFY